MPRRGIDRRSPVPYYEQLKRLLRAEISRGPLGPGARLPGDHQLCERYSVSRTVVRQALSELEYEGVIERVKGRGTFVAAERPTQGLVASLTGLYEDVALHGLQLRSVVQRQVEIPAPPSVAAELGLAAGDPVVRVERLRFVEGEPWVLVTNHLPVGIVPGLVDADLTDRSLYALMEQYGVRPVRGRRTVEARLASAAQSTALGIRRGAAVLVLRSVGHDAKGRAVESFEAVHRGDRSRFEVDLALQDQPVRAPLMVLPHHAPAGAG